MISLDTSSALNVVAQTLTKLAIYEHNSGDPQFTTGENTLYTSIILHYATIAPTLSICNFTLHSKKSYKNFCTIIA